MNRFAPILAALAAVAVLVAGAWWYFSRPAPSIGTAQPAAAAGTDQPATGAAAEVPAMWIGNPEAKVRVVEYASFTCPHCRHFHETVFGELEHNYIAPGKIRFELREVYFDRYGLWAAMLARCDGSAEKYFGIVDLIFRRQREWTSGESDEQIIQNLYRLGRAAGLTDEKMDACLHDQDMAEKLVAAFQENVTRDGVNATPTFFVNGVKHSNMGYAEFARILDEALAN
ncbi:MAG: DsbA family protein [Alphaproteobacteria bacterium]|nr:MAG: DsbA family protein [Alphaproteobacteria bacterium]